MELQAGNIRLHLTYVGESYVVRSPDVPELYVVDADRQKAVESVQSALDMILRMRDRKRAKIAHGRRLQVA